MPARSPATPAFDVAPARAALRRLLPRWQALFRLRAIARHGINEVFVSIGSAQVYRRTTFHDFGYSDAQFRTWMPALAHQP